MEPTILRFILFLGAELLFIIASLLPIYIMGTFIFRTKKLKNEYAILVTLLATLISIVFISLFMKILTGESYISPLVVIFMASVVLMLLVEFLWLIFGSTNIPWFGRLVWADCEFQNSHRVIHISLQLLSVAILFIYPVYIGIGYFSDIFASPEWNKYVLKSTVAILIGASWLALIPRMIYVLLSKNLLEGTRSRIFVNHSVGSISILLLISLFIWTIDASGTTVPLLGEYFVFSSTVGYATVAYLIAIVIVPYLIGHFRAKHWIEFLQIKESEILEAASKAFTAPNVNTALCGLSSAEELIDRGLHKIDGDKSISLARKISETEDDKHLVFRIGLNDSKNRDPRLIHHNKLCELHNLVSECRTEIELKENDESKREILNAYGRSLGQHKIIESVSNKQWPIILITSLTMSFITPVLSSLGKFVVSHVGGI